jgi:hypothetical protein
MEEEKQGPPRITNNSGLPRIAQDGGDSLDVGLAVPKLG